MDIATLIGLLGGFGLIATTIVLGGNVMGFLDPPSMVVVVGGTFTAVFTMFPLKTVIGSFKVILKTLFAKTADPVQIINDISTLSEKARKESLVALEKVPLDNEFLKKGVMLVVDGSEETTVRSLMENEIKFMKQRHYSGQGVLKGMGATAPAFGMIGTLIGLVQMLQNLSDPSSIGPAMAVALLTTFYGAVLANVVFLPMAKKLEERSAEDALFMEIILEGVISILRGEHPTLVKEKLMAFLAPAMRQSSEK